MRVKLVKKHEKENLMFRKKCALRSAALLIAVCMVLAGCSSGSTDSAETETVASYTTVSGTITAISDTQITVSDMAAGGSAPSGDASLGDAGSMELPEGESFDGSEEIGDAGSMEFPEGESFDASAEMGDAGSMEVPEGESFDASAGIGDAGSMEVPEGESFDGSEEIGDAGSMEIPEGESFDASADAGDAGSMEIPEGESFDGSADATYSAGDETTLALTDDTLYYDADGNTIALSDLAVGDYVVIEADDDGNAVTVTLSGEDTAQTAQAGGLGQSAGGGSQTSSDITYTAVYEYTADTEVSAQTYTSTGTDENAVLVSSGAKVTLDSVTVTRTSDDSTGGDNSSFYGVGAAVLVTDGEVTISGSTITTDAAGGAGVFAYGDGTATVSDTVITTSADTSGGIHVAGGGTLYAYDLTVTTYGESSAAIRSDRGSGTMVVDGGTYTSNGTGSPAVYSTADITASNAVLTANASEAACIEGQNSITLADCDLTGNMADDSQNDCTWTVILYQSMSGDSEEGESEFSMTGGTLTSLNGGLFYTTNTESSFYLEGVTISASDDCEFLLRCTGNANERGWGSTGSNGADCEFTAVSMEMEGDIIWDSISELEVTLVDTTWTGAFIQDETYAGNGGDGEVWLTIEEDSVWIVTGDSVLSELENEGTITDASGNTVSVIGTDGTVYVSGTSAYTITVESYSD